MAETTDTVRERDVRRVVFDGRDIRCVKEYVFAVDLCNAIEGERSDWKQIIKEAGTETVHLTIVRQELDLSDDSEDVSDDDDSDEDGPVCFTTGAAPMNPLFKKRSEWREEKEDQRGNDGQKWVVGALNAEGVARVLYCSNRTHRVCQFLEEALEDVLGIRKFDSYFHGLERSLFFRNDPTMPKVPPQEVLKLPSGITIIGWLNSKEKMDILLRYVSQKNKITTVRNSHSYSEYSVSFREEQGVEAKKVTVMRRSGAGVKGSLVTMHAEKMVDTSKKRRKKKPTATRKRRRESDASSDEEHYIRIERRETPGRGVQDTVISSDLHRYCASELAKARKKAKCPPSTTLGVPDEYGILPQHTVLCIIYLALRSGSIIFRNGAFGRRARTPSVSSFKSSTEGSEKTWRLPWEEARQREELSGREAPQLSNSMKIIQNAVCYLVDMEELNHELIIPLLRQAEATVAAHPCISEGLEALNEIAVMGVKAMKRSHDRP